MKGDSVDRGRWDELGGYNGGNIGIEQRLERINEMITEGINNSQAPLERSPSPALTYYIQRHYIALDGLRGHLTLVGSLVPFLDVFNLQRPLVGVLVVGRLKPLIRCVGVCIHRQHVNVPVTHPGDLQVEIGSIMSFII